MKICLFGATGLLGSEFGKVFRAQKLDFVAPRSHEVSLLKHDKVLEYLKKEAPTLIVNCAAYTAVDKAEKEVGICRALNAETIENLVKAGIPLINFSTEYVFKAPKFNTDGKASTAHLPLGEAQGAGSVIDPPPSNSPQQGERNSEYFEIPEDFSRDPQSVYGKSKARAEEILENSNIDWWNIRTSWLWGPGGNNFVATIRRLSQKYDELKIIDDQIGRPTYAPELAAFVTENFVVPMDQSSNSTSERKVRVRTQVPPKGHYHLQNQGAPVSWAEFAQYFLNQQGWHGTIKKISTDEYGAPAARPKNSILKNTKLENGLRGWKEAVRDYLDE